MHRSGTEIIRTQIHTEAIRNQTQTVHTVRQPLSFKMKPLVDVLLKKINVNFTKTLLFLYVSDLIENLDDRFSHDAAHLLSVFSFIYGLGCIPFSSGTISRCFQGNIS